VCEYIYIYVCICMYIYTLVIVYVCLCAGQLLNKTLRIKSARTVLLHVCVCGKLRARIPAEHRTPEMNVTYQPQSRWCVYVCACVCACVCAHTHKAQSPNTKMLSKNSCNNCMYVHACMYACRHRHAALNIARRC
jgi:hypothetical protein